MTSLQAGDTEKVSTMCKHKCSIIFNTTYFQNVLFYPEDGMEKRYFDIDHCRELF
jgi:hypothetical protein